MCSNWNSSFKILYLFIFRDRGREKEVEKYQCVVAFCAPLLESWPATQACALTGNFFKFFFIIKHFSFIAVQLQLSAFSPLPPTPPQTNPPPSPASTLPLGIIYVSFIVAPENLSPTIPSPLPSGYC